MVAGSALQPSTLSESIPCNHCRRHCGGGGGRRRRRRCFYSC
eukprot:COSAG05_NODE_24721_length_227_cov_158.078125_1_plen_41_part_10